MKTKLPLLLVITATLLVFGYTAKNQFIVLDDPLHITENQNLLRGDLASFWKEPYRGLYIPVTYTLWGIEKKLTDMFIGRDATGMISPLLFHLDNIVLHAANAAMAFLIFCLLFPGNMWAAAAGALFFALHPLQVESVAWVSGRKDLISGLFALLSVWFWLKWLETVKEAKSLKEQFQTSKAFPYVCSVVSFVLALLCKPSVLVLPFIMGILAYCFIQKNKRAAIASIIPWTIAVIPFGLFMPSLQPWETKLDPPHLLLRPLIALDALTFYFYKLVYPMQLGLDYARTPDWVISQGYLFWTPLIAVSIAYGLTLLKRKEPILLLAIFTFAIAPVSGILPFAFQQFSTVADRYMYLALIAPAIGLILFLRETKAVAARAMVVFVLASYGAMSFYQGQKWVDNMTIFNHTLSFIPRSILAHSNIGTIFEELGDVEAARRHYEASLTINPHFPHHYYNLGNIYHKMGREDLAKPLLEQTIKRQPQFFVAYYGLARIAYSQKNYAEAEKLVKQSLEIEPNQFRAITLLGVLQKERGEGDLGKALFEKALRNNPHFIPAHLNLAELADKKNDIQKAWDHYVHILRRDPYNEVARERYAQLKPIVKDVRENN